MVNLFRWLGGFLGGYFVSDTGVIEGDGKPNTWLILAFAFVGYLIFKEFNK